MSVCKHVCACKADNPVCMCDSVFLLTHFLFYNMSSSFQIFCVRNKVCMRNFTEGRGKSTLDYMVRKYESECVQVR